MADTKELVIELALENAKLKKGLSEAGKETEKAGKGIKGSIGDIKAAWIAAAAAIAGVVMALKSVVNAAIQQEQADKRLARSLASVGDASKESFRAMQSFASEMQRTTGVADDQVQNLISLGLQMGVSSTKIKDATKSAIGLSNAFGVDLETSMKMVALANKGEYEMLGRYIPALRTATTEAEKQAIVQQAMANGMDLATANMDTMSGRMDRLKNTFGDIQEVFGFAVLRAIDPVVQKLQEFVDSEEGMQTIVAAAKAFAVALIVIKSAVMGVFDTIKDLSKFWTNFTTSFGKFSEALKTRSGLGEAIKSMATDVGDLYKDRVTGMIDRTKETAKEIADVMKMSNADMTQSGVQAVEGLSGVQQEAHNENIDRIKEEERIKLESLKRADEASRKAFEAEMQRRKMIADATQASYDSLKETVGLFFDNMNARADIEAQKETDRINASFEAEKAGLDAKLEQGIISQEEYNTQLATLDEQRRIAEESAERKAAKTQAEIARKQAVWNKATSLVDTIIKTSQAIMSAMTIPPPAGQIFAGIAAAMGAAQAALISGQPIPAVPAFASGGVIDSVMPARISGEDGLIAARRGESVLNQQATAMLGRDAIDALNAGRPAGSVTINVTTNNGREVVQVLNDYFRKYGNSARGVAL